MTIKAQALDPGSVLCRFLDSRLPHRDVVSASLREMIDAVQTTSIADTDQRRLDLALQMRIGLDLAPQPDHLSFLGCLPADRCIRLLEACGFRGHEYPDLPQTHTTDPMVARWSRKSQPASLDDAQRKALYDLITMAGLEPLTEGLATTVQESRVMLAVIERNRRRAGKEAQLFPLLQALEQLTHRYLRNGREQLEPLGERVIVAPQIMPLFAYADLILGKSLVKVSAHCRPGDHIGEWLDELLGYILLDRWNVLWVDRIALYLGWRSQVLQVDISDLLRTASGSSAAPRLADLREDFASEIRADVDHALWHYLVATYGIPDHALDSPGAE